MIIGYTRDSTNGQALDAQIAQLKAAGVDKIFKEKASGAKTDREQLAKAIVALDDDDVLIICRLDGALDL